ncbi:outer membrane beta-barrel protein [Prevotella sp. tf2-5]|uniref:outer membrane beta-barrel protein n=1 Tax=Prevotella sp. tf2-5 TaxID=1761889 RepID=UPI000B81BD18|nr:outer membrane beta-barrel protein [Prevotella sp. tf2-5]
MKKILMTLVAVAMATTMNAQWYVGGTVGYNYTKDKNTDVKSNTFVITPELGYNLNEKWAVGMKIGYAYNKVDDAKSNEFVVNPYARYTFVKLDKVNFFVDGGFEYNYVKVEDDSANGFGISFKPGVAVNLNEKISFVAHVGNFGWSSAKAKNAKSVQSVDLGLNLASVDFGLYYNF